MAFDYSGLVTVAETLLDSFGREVILQVASKTPADSAKSWGARETPAVATDDQIITGVKAVFVAPEKEDKEASTTRKRRERAFVAPGELSGAVIDDSWQLVDGTTIYEIVRASPKQPGGSLILYDLLLEV